MNYEVIKGVKGHLELQNEVTLELWPEFMLHDPVSQKYWSKLYELFPEYQFSLKYEGEIIGTGNCLPYFWDKSFTELPEKGWDWVFEKGFEYVTIPIRPSLKSNYPLIPMDNYIKWKREKDGQPYDPWLRVHQRAGGKVIKVCHEAMYIPGSIKEWEEWTGLKFKESGEYIVDGALSPVKIDLNKDLGEYTEANVWILHKVN